MVLVSQATAGEAERSWKNSLEMTMTGIPAGSFVMGSGGKEYPRHLVILSRSFYMSAHEVTNEQFDAFTRETGITLRTDQRRQSFYPWKRDPQYAEDDHPAGVSWEEAAAFCRWLSEKEGRIYRLPTEAEWEYAARGGLEGKRYPWGDAMDHSVCWGKPLPSEERYQPVGRFAPNGYGLYDMGGNRYEWCADWFDPFYYHDSPVIDPKGPTEPLSMEQMRRREGFGLSENVLVEWHGRKAFAQRVVRLQPSIVMRDFWYPDQESSAGGGFSGFRVVCEVEAGRQVRWEIPTREEPEPAARSPAPRAASVPDFVNSIDMAFVSIPAGVFQMGTDRGASWEGPVRYVTLSQPFHLGRFEVTNVQYERFDSSFRRSPYSPGDDGPALNIRWHEAEAFCRWLGAQEGRVYRLPTEAEWEYAARGGIEGADYPWGGSSREPFCVGQKRAWSVGCSSPNGYGLFDMAGNAWEWCQDLYFPYAYEKLPQSDPTTRTWESESEQIRKQAPRVMRGGGWYNERPVCTVWRRDVCTSLHYANQVGFRVLLEGEVGATDRTGGR
jgi:formylglycine-generating enzyme required for sulfatase activity